MKAKTIQAIKTEKQPKNDRYKPKMKDTNSKRKLIRTRQTHSNIYYQRKLTKKTQKYYRISRYKPTLTYTTRKKSKKKNTQKRKRQQYKI